MAVSLHNLAQDMDIFLMLHVRMLQ